MATYKPYGNKELQDLLQQAKRQNLPVLTRHQRTEGIGIDFQNWNRIREIDTANLTVTAERAVTLGELEDAVHEYGLHMAAMTEDLRSVSLGDFFAEKAAKCDLVLVTESKTYTSQCSFISTMKLNIDGEIYNTTCQSLPHTFIHFKYA